MASKGLAVAISSVSALFRGVDSTKVSHAVWRFHVTAFHGRASPDLFRVIG
jgi:hypothetical protein